MALNRCVLSGSNLPALNHNVNNFTRNLRRRSSITRSRRVITLSRSSTVLALSFNTLRTTAPIYGAPQIAVSSPVLVTTLDQRSVVLNFNSGSTHSVMELSSAPAYSFNAADRRST